MLKPPHLLAGGIECLVSPQDLPPSQWHDIYLNGLESTGQVLMLLEYPEL